MPEKKMNRQQKRRSLRQKFTDRAKQKLISPKLIKKMVMEKLTNIFPLNLKISYGETIISFSLMDAYKGENGLYWLGFKEEKEDVKKLEEKP